MAKEKREIKVEIEIPEGITIEIGELVKVKGKAGEVTKNLSNPNVKISKDGNKIVLKALKSTKREQKIVNTFRAHINNMLKGANETYKYKLKICSGHFPMNVSVKGNEFIVKNFFGEKIPRVLKLNEGANVKVEGDIINVESPDKEIAGQVAASIEQLVKRTNYDTRIFQDGIWIIEKCGNELK
jgi:large subunit ribosomal protein L6